MKKVLIVFGTRPEAIKMAPLVKAFSHRKELFNSKVCITGQHKEMLDQVLNAFKITPDYYLSVMESGQDLFDLTSRILLNMRHVLQEFEPDLVLVHGDTTTSSTAALAAFYKQIPVGHVEAGLRTHNLYSPWPEELNRQLTSRIAQFHFAPTKASKENLLNENIPEQQIFVTGNTVIDALHMVTGEMKNRIHSEPVMETLAKHGIHRNTVEDWGNGRRLVLITGHRRENFGTGFLNICAAIKELANNFPKVDFVYPVHLNPAVAGPVYKLLKQHGTHERQLSNVYLLPPLDYFPFVFLMQKSHFLLTDSGGVQEEAPGLGKPVIVMRNTTERPEAVAAGTVRLSGTDKDSIIHEASRLLLEKSHYEKMATAHNPYGDGKASERIVRHIINSLFKNHLETESFSNYE